MPKTTLMAEPAIATQTQAPCWWLDAVLGVAGVLAVVSLVLLYGWSGDLPMPELNLWGVDIMPSRSTLVILQLCVAGLLMVERFCRLMLAGGPREFFRARWVDFAMIALTLAAVLLALLADGHALAGDAIWVIFAQVYIVFALAMRAAGMKFWPGLLRIHPMWLLVCGFIFLSVAGALLLVLPTASSSSAGILWFQDALFTSASAVSLTGLSLRDVGKEFSFMGQFVILALIQVGGLAIMLLGTALAVTFGRGLGLRHGQDVHTLPGGPDSPRPLRLGQMARFVIVATFGIELIGAVMLYPMFLDNLDAHEQLMGPLQAAWYAIFHSVSAFCNAGFMLWQHDVSKYRDQWQTLGIIGPLVILGGLGMPVLQDLARSLSTMVHRIRRRLHEGSGPWWPTLCPRLSLHSKVVLWTSLLLVFFGTSGILLVETVGMKVTAAEPGAYHQNDFDTRSEFEKLTPTQRLEACGMLSISSRTGGFATINVAEMSDAGKAVTCVLMAVGASPGSAGGGMKTVTFALLVVFVLAGLRRHGRAEVFGKTVSQGLIRNAVTMVAMYALLVAVVAITLSICMRSHGRFMDMLFESISACSNVGLSAGVTNKLNDYGKFDLIFGMLAGRLGLPAMALLLISHRRESIVLG